MLWLCDCVLWLPLLPSKMIYVAIRIVIFILILLCLCLSLSLSHLPPSPSSLFYLLYPPLIILSSSSHHPLIIIITLIIPLSSPSSQRPFFHCHTLGALHGHLSLTQTPHSPYRYFKVNQLRGSSGESYTLFIHVIVEVLLTSDFMIL